MLRITYALFVAAALIASPRFALSEHCARCGCCAHLRKVCRPIYETKETPQTEWEVECEDFCVPGPSRLTYAADECGQPVKQWTATCACVRTRKKLVKKEVVKAVPTIRWVVETLCCDCLEAASYAGATAAPARPSAK